MLKHKMPPSRVTLSLRTQYASAWITKWQTTVSHGLLPVIEANHLTLHSATSGDWLASVNWGHERIVVTEAQGESPPYVFSGAKAAFIFLDALLMHYAARITEAYESTDLLFLPIVGAL